MAQLQLSSTLNKNWGHMPKRFSKRIQNIKPNKKGEGEVEN